jgi:hypothetical protein
MKSAHQVAVMENDEFVQCPLSDGPAQVRRADLSALLDGANLRGEIEKDMANSRPSLDQAVRRLRNSPRRVEMFAAAG